MSRGKKSSAFVASLRSLTENKTESKNNTNMSSSKRPKKKSKNKARNFNNQRKYVSLSLLLCPTSNSIYRADDIKDHEFGALMKESKKQNKKLAADQPKSAAGEMVSTTTDVLYAIYLFLLAFWLRLTTKSPQSTPLSTFTSASGKTSPSSTSTEKKPTSGTKQPYLPPGYTPQMMVDLIHATITRLECQQLYDKIQADLVNVLEKRPGEELTDAQRKVLHEGEKNLVAAATALMDAQREALDDEPENSAAAAKALGLDPMDVFGDVQDNEKESSDVTDTTPEQSETPEDTQTPNDGDTHNHIVQQQAFENPELPQSDVVVQPSIKGDVEVSDDPVDPQIDEITLQQDAAQASVAQNTDIEPAVETSTSSDDEHTLIESPKSEKLPDSDASHSRQSSGTITVDSINISAKNFDPLNVTLDSPTHLSPLSSPVQSVTQEPLEIQSGDFTFNAKTNAETKPETQESNTPVESSLARVSSARAEPENAAASPAESGPDLDSEQPTESQNVVDNAPELPQTFDDFDGELQAALGNIKALGTKLTPAEFHSIKDATLRGLRDAHELGVSIIDQKNHGFPGASAVPLPLDDSEMADASVLIPAVENAPTDGNEPAIYNSADTKIVNYCFDNTADWDGSSELSFADSQLINEHEREQEAAENATIDTADVHEPSGEEMHLSFTHATGNHADDTSAVHEPIPEEKYPSFTDIDEADDVPSAVENHQPPKQLKAEHPSTDDVLEPFPVFDTHQPSEVESWSGPAICRMPEGDATGPYFGTHEPVTDVSNQVDESSQPQRPEEEAAATTQLDTVEKSTGAADSEVEPWSGPFIARLPEGDANNLTPNAPAAEEHAKYVSAFDNGLGDDAVFQLFALPEPTESPSSSKPSSRQTSGTYATDAIETQASSLADGVEAAEFAKTLSNEQTPPPADDTPVDAASKVEPRTKSAVGKSILAEVLTQLHRGKPANDNESSILADEQKSEPITKASDHEADFVQTTAVNDGAIQLSLTLTDIEQALHKETLQHPVNVSIDHHTWDDVRIVSNTIENNFKNNFDANDLPKSRMKSFRFFNGLDIEVRFDAIVNSKSFDYRQLARLSDTKSLILPAPGPPCPSVETQSSQVIEFFDEFVHLPHNTIYFGEIKCVIPPRVQVEATSKPRHNVGKNRKNKIVIRLPGMDAPKVVSKSSSQVLKVFSSSSSTGIFDKSSPQSAPTITLTPPTPESSVVHTESTSTTSSSKAGASANQPTLSAQAAPAAGQHPVPAQLASPLHKTFAQILKQNSADVKKPAAQPGSSSGPQVGAPTEKLSSTLATSSFSETTKSATSQASKSTSTPPNASCTSSNAQQASTHAPSTLPPPKLSAHPKPISFAPVVPKWAQNLGAQSAVPQSKVIIPSSPCGQSWSKIAAPSRK